MLCVSNSTHAQSAKSDSLFAIGVNLYNEGKYERAIPIFEQSDKLDKIELGLSSNRRDYSAMWLASCYYQLGDTLIAKELSTFYKNPIDRRLTKQSDSLFVLGQKELAEKHYDASLEKFRICGILEKEKLGDMNMWYGNTILQCANVCYLLNDSIDLLGYIKQYSDIVRNCFGVSIQYAESLREIASFYLLYEFDNNKELSVEYFIQADSIYLKVNKHHDIELINFINDFSSLLYMDYYNREEYKEAIKYVDCSIKYHPDATDYIGYVKKMDDKAVILCNLGDYDEAISLSIEGIKILNENEFRTSLLYSSLLEKIASYYTYKNNYKESINYEKEALSIIEALESENSVYYTDALNKIAEYSYNIGNYQDAIYYESRLLKILETLKGEEHPDCVTIMLQLARYSFENGDYKESLSLCHKASEIIKVLYGSRHHYYAVSLADLATYNSLIGNNAEALKFASEASEIFEMLDEHNKPYYVQLLNNMSYIYSRLGSNDIALELCQKALSILNNVDNSDFLNVFTKHNFANALSNMKKHNDAILSRKENLNLIERIYGKSHIYYITELTCIASDYFFLGQYDKALICCKTSIDIANRVLGDKHPNYIELLWRITNVYNSLADESLLTQYAESTSKLICDIVFRNFVNMTQKERNSFWNNYKEWFEDDINLYAYNHNKNKLLCSEAYNCCLLSKGILLNSMNEMEKLVVEKGNSDVISIYKMYKDACINLNNMYSKPKEQQYSNVDSLENQINKLEQELIASVKEYGDFTKNLKIKWEDIRNNITENDVCLEFSSLLVNGDRQYIVFVLKSDMSNPVLIPLFEEKQLKNGNNTYTPCNLSKIIWEPLAEHLNKVKNIYFAPSGELYNISIESLPHWSEDCLMSDKWNMYRLSSTRQLAVIKDKGSLKKASVYGGVKYDTKEDLLIADSKRYKSRERSLNYEPFEIADSLNLRSGAAYLPATKAEAEEIDKTLEQKKITTSLQLDTLATEGAFKDLSGKQTNLLHIATHGFYWTEKEAKFRNNLSFLMLGDNQPRYVEDKALTRSGLLLAGANNALMGKKLPEGVDDGILTAKEISQLDLRGLDLVVLSACQTGLGEIKGDGVFGLQRGFKKAGANSLLMSLWKVDDEATRLLMTQFYKNLTSGMSKYESLKLAQKYVREYKIEVEVKSDVRPSVSVHAKEQAHQNSSKEKEYKKVKKYQDPYYWAAFILLDAID